MKYISLFTMASMLFCTTLFSQVKTVTPPAESITSNSRFLFNQILFDTLAADQKDNFFNDLKLLNCISGTVYLSGAGFLNTVAIQYQGSTGAIQKYLELFTHDSKISFEKCIFKNKDGAMLTVNKSIFFR